MPVPQKIDISSFDTTKKVDGIDISAFSDDVKKKVGSGPSLTKPNTGGGQPAPTPSSQPITFNSNIPSSLGDGKTALQKDLDFKFSVSLSNQAKPDDKFSLKNLSALNPDPGILNMPHEQQVEAVKRQIETDPDLLKEYRQNRMAEIKQVKDKAELEKSAATAFVPTRGMNDTRENTTIVYDPLVVAAADEKITASDTYQKELQKSIQESATIAVPKSFIDNGLPLDSKAVGRKWLETIGDPTVKDDATILADLKKNDMVASALEIPVPKYSPDDIAKTQQGIEYKHDSVGYKVLSDFYSTQAKEIANLGSDKVIAYLNAKQNRANAKSPAEIINLDQQIKTMLEDETVNKFQEAASQSEAYAKNAKEAIDQYPQVKRNALRQQANDVFFDMVSEDYNPADVTGFNLLKKAFVGVFGRTPTQDEIKEIAGRTGKPVEEIQSIVDEGGFFKDTPYPIRYNGFLQNVGGSGKELITQSVMGVNRLINGAGATTENAVSQKILDEYNLQAQKNKLIDDYGKWNINPGSIFSVMGRAVGQSVLLGGPASKLASFAAAGSLTAKGIMAATTVASIYPSAFEQGFQEASLHTDDDQTRRVYAHTYALANSLPEVILPEGEILNKVRGVGVANGFEDFAKEVGEKGLLATAREKSVAFSKEFLKVVAAENIEEQITNVATNVADEQMFGVKRTASEWLTQAFQTAVQTTLGTIPLGIGAGLGARHDASGVRKETYFEMGNDPEVSKFNLQQLHDKGDISQDQLNQKIQVVNTMADIVAGVNKMTKPDGSQYSYDEKAEIAAQQYRINHNNAIAKDNPISAVKAIVEQDNIEAEAIQNSILNPPNTQNDENKVSAEQLANGGNNPTEAQANLSSQAVPGVNQANEQGQVNESQPGAAAEVVAPVAETSIVQDYDKANAFIVGDEARADVAGVVSKINNADYINEGELTKAADHLYDLLDKYGDNQSFSNLIEPLINKIEGYEFATKTETSTVTETVPTEVARTPRQRQGIDNSLGQWEGSRATITDGAGKSVEGQIRTEDGNYYLYDNEGQKVAALGEKAITDRSITLPGKDVVDNPISFNDAGDIESITLQLNKVNEADGGLVPAKLITVTFKDQDKALDYAIRLRADQVGEVPEPEFETIYQEIVKEIQKEVPVRNISSPKINNDAIQEQSTTGSVLRDEGVQRESGLQGVGQENGPEIVTKESQNTQVDENTEAAKPEVPVTTESSSTGTQTTDENQQRPATPPPTTGENTADEGDEEAPVGITQAAVAEMRKKLGLPPYDRTRVTDASLESLADQIIANGYDINKLIEKIEGGTQPNALETVILGKYKAVLDAQVSANPSDENLRLAKRFADAVDLSGTEEGRAFRLRRFIPVGDQSLSDFFVLEMENEHVDTLTDEQKKTVSAEFNEINNAQAAAAEATLKLEEAAAEKKAQEQINKIKKESTAKIQKKSHEEYVKEREKIAEKIKNKLKKFRSGEEGLSAVPLPYVRELYAIAPDIASYVRSLADEGLTKLGEVTDNIFDILKDNIPEATKRDAHDLIAGVYNVNTKTKNELTEKVRDWREEAKLLNKLEKLLNGEESSSAIKNLQRNKEITQLRETIKNIQRKNSLEKNEANDFYTEDFLYDAAKLNQAATRYNKDADKIEQEIKSGVFAPLEKKIPLSENSELKKNFPELYKKAIDAQDRAIKARKDREIRLAQQQYKNRSTARKWFDAIATPFREVRTIKASFDYSAPLRQGIIPTMFEVVTNPKQAAKRMGTMFKASANERFFDRWMDDVRSSPMWPIMQQSGLAIADPNNITTKEEVFQSKLAEKIPILGTYGIKGSERAYAYFLNSQRIDMFAKGVGLMIDKGMTMENSKEAYKAWGKTVNTLTGRGELIEPFKSAAGLLSMGFFSPRLIAARMAIFNPLFYKDIPRPLRWMVAKQMSAFVGVGTSILIAISLAHGSDDKDKGWSVEWDPRSPDFGKIRHGNTRYDIWGGFQQYIRLFATLGTQSKKTGTGQIVSLQTKKENKSGSVIGTFFRSKASPLLGSSINILTGTDVVGNPTTLSSEAKTFLLPLIASDTYDAIQDKGVESVPIVTIPAIFGVGVSTYKKK